MSKDMSETNKELEAVLGAHRTRIHIIGTGGAGNNTVSRLLETGIQGVEAIAINTDAQDLLFANAHHKILIGKNITNGLGAGSDPAIGAESARESAGEIESIIADSDMVFVTCGLGGGTGTGSAPVIAEIARNAGTLTIAVVTLPFTEEGVVRWENARAGLEELQSKVDTVIVVQNDRLLELVPDMPLQAAFKEADEILVNAVKGITELVTEKGLVNLDFADVRTIMKNGGLAMVGLGESDSENNAMEAAEKALTNPLLDVDVTGAKSALINISGGSDMSLKSAKTVMKIIAERLDPSARIIWGARVDESMNGTLRVMLIVTCLKATKRSATEIDMAMKKRKITGSTSKKESAKIAASKAEESAGKEAPVEAETGERKKNARVFSEIFIEETKADLFVLEEAIKGLATGNRARNEKYLREIKNAIQSVKNSAELFSYNQLVELLDVIGRVTEKAVAGAFDLPESFIQLYKKVPATLSGLMDGQHDADQDQREIHEKFENVLELLEEGRTPASAQDDKKQAGGGGPRKAAGSEEEIEVIDALVAGENGGDRKPTFTNVDEAVKYINKLF